MQWRGEAFAGVGAAAADDAVEEALVEDRGQEVEGRVLVGQREEYGRLPVGTSVAALVLVLVSADPVDAEVVVGEDLPDRADGQWGEAHAEADDDALLGLSGALGEGPVLAGGELQALGETPCLPQVRVVVVRALAFPFGAGLLVYFSGGPGDGVDLAFLGLVLFAGLEQVAHVGHRVEGLAGFDVQAVLEDVVGQVVDERGERGQQAAFGFGPEVVGLVLLGCGAVGVVHDVGDQAHYRHVGLVGVDVAHGVEFRPAGQVHQVELFDRVSHFLQFSTGLRVEFALGVGARVVHAAFEDVGDDVGGGLAGAGAADDGGVEVASRGLGVEAQALGGRHLEVLPGVAVGVWGHLPAGGPACGPVFLAFAPVALAHTPPVEVEQADRARAAQSA